MFGLQDLQTRLSQDLQGWEINTKTATRRNPNMFE
jgi:hypothetical protein